MFSSKDTPSFANSFRTCFPKGAWPNNYFFHPQHVLCDRVRRRCRNMQSIELDNLSQLRKFVSQTLCQRNDFEEGVFQVTERILTKCGKLCGVFFCLHGPRSVKLTAVWETENNSISFYGSTGEKFQKTLLTDAPRLVGSI